jgi:hypothetical protein
MAQALTGKVQELVGDWGGAEVEAEWMGIAREQVPVGIACVPVAGQKSLTRRAFLAMT